jgi:hypothetical protein
MTSTLTSSSDRIDVINELATRNRWMMLLCLFGLALGLFGLVVAFIAFARPLPVVYRSENPYEPAALTTAGVDAQPREVDAKRFFVETAERLHGWDSAGVEGSFRAAARLMTSEWRKKFVAEVSEAIPVPTEVDQSGKASRLASYMAARIRNELTVDYDSLKCVKAENFWHCRGKATMAIQPLVGAPVDNPKLKKNLAIKASFQVVPATAMTLDGLLVSFWDAQEAE